jgi:hypothetical protein
MGIEYVGRLEGRHLLLAGTGHVELLLLAQLMFVDVVAFHHQAYTQRAPDVLQR